MKKRNLYFLKGEEKRLVTSCSDVNSAIELINEFCKERNSKIHYSRTWVSDDGIMFDVGSHTEFFLLES